MEKRDKMRREMALVEGGEGDGGGQLKGSLFQSTFQNALSGASVLISNSMLRSVLCLRLLLPFARAWHAHAW